MNFSFVRKLFFFISTVEQFASRSEFNWAREWRRKIYKLQRSFFFGGFSDVRQNWRCSCAWSATIVEFWRNFSHNRESFFGCCWNESISSALCLLTHIASKFYESLMENHLLQMTAQEFLKGVVKARYNWRKPDSVKWWALAIIYSIIGT
jgi:hypothetical protein